MNWWVDAIVAAIIVGFGALGVRSGAARQTAATIGVLLAAVIGFEWFPRLAHYSLVLAGSLVIDERWTQFLTSVLAFLLIILVVAVGVGRWVAVPARLTPLRRVVGLAIGLVNGFLIAAFLIRYAHEFLFAADPRNPILQSVAGAFLIQWLGIALLVPVAVLVPVFLYHVAGRLVALAAGRRERRVKPAPASERGWEEAASATAGVAPEAER